jgi:uncharacterized protein (TIGR02145 family)
MIQDYDGNSYEEITIGTQVWLDSNLKTTHYNDGVAIGEGDGYWWYNDDPNTKDPWGALYNWYAVYYGTLAPIGYHIPTEAEWQTLLDYLGTDPGHQLKVTGDTYWGSSTYTGTTSLPMDSTIIGLRTDNPGGTVTFSIPSGMTNHSWSVSGGTLSGNPPTIISGGGTNDNFIEVELHIPNPAKINVNYISTESVTGSTNWYHFTTENSESTNSSGFSAIPNGYRRFCGNIIAHGGVGYYWGMSNDPANNTKYLIIPANEYGAPNNVMLTRSKWDFAPSHYQTYAFSVRCIKN